MDGWMEWRGEEQARGGDSLENTGSREALFGHVCIGLPDWSVYPRIVLVDGSEI